MEQTMRILENSIFDVFEKMFFIYLESTDRIEAGPVLRSSIAFSGERAGTIELFFTSPFLDLMAQNMLSLGPGEAGESEREDCAGEAANMVCGNFLALLDRTRRYDLTIPACTVAASVPESKNRLNYKASVDAWGMAVVLSGQVAEPE